MFGQNVIKEYNNVVIYNNKLSRHRFERLG